LTFSFEARYCLRAWTYWPASVVPSSDGQVDFDTTSLELGDASLEVSETVVATVDIVQANVLEGVGARDVDHAGTSKGKVNSVDGNGGSILGKSLQLGWTIGWVQEEVTTDRGSGIGGAGKEKSRGN
jgi:hypothetical protein